MLGGLFLIVVGAEKIGLHGTLGALLFGVALSGLPQRIHWEIMPGMRSASEGLFVPLFFASAGLQFDLSFTAIPLGTIVALAVIPLAGKFVGAFLSTYLTRIEAPFTLATGLMSKGVAEIALLLVLLELGVIGQDVFSLFVLIMFGYILFMPPIIGFAIKRTRLTSAAVLPQSVPLSYVRPGASGRQSELGSRPHAHLPRPARDGAELYRGLGGAEGARLRGGGRRRQGGRHRVVGQDPVDRRGPAR